MIRPPLKIITGNSNRNLAERVAAYLKLPLAACTVKRFADQEVFVQIEENVRGVDLFILQSTSVPTNDYLMELLIMIDAARRSSARRITAVVPYFGYGRQDRRTMGRTPISAKLVANLITEAGADRVMTLDLHAGQIQGFFDIPTDNLFASPTFVNDINEQSYRKPVLVVSPDIGGVVRARYLANQLRVGLAIIDKRRDEPNLSEVTNIIGKVKGFTCVLIDDIADTGGTLIKASDALLEAGADAVYAYATHGVLSKDSTHKIEQSSLSGLVVTNSIAREVKGNRDRPSKIRTLDISSLLGEAISRTACETSVSSLFD